MHSNYEFSTQFFVYELIVYFFEKYVKNNDETLGAEGYQTESSYQASATSTDRTESTSGEK